MAQRTVDELLEKKDAFKHTLDSDEEDDEVKEESYDVMNENDIEGVEDGPSAAETNIGFTAFNMKEELEEGHFDKEGHYHWKKEKEIRDNWLDNIDWVKVKSKEDDSKDKKDSDDSDEEGAFMFDPTNLYKQISEYLQPGESVSKALCRLGKGTKKLTTAEKWKRKKDPNAAKEDGETSAKITKLTEVANELLTQTGNMDIYQETYEQIQKKIAQAEKHSTKVEAELDMFSDDFDSKEKDKKQDTKAEEASTSQNTEGTSSKDEPADDNEVSWELKWSQAEDAKVHGPNTSQQMHEWAKEGYFKKGAWVRKKGQAGEFYNASRIDFELYI